MGCGGCSIIIRSNKGDRGTCEIGAPVSSAAGRAADHFWIGSE